MKFGLYPLFKNNASKQGEFLAAGVEYYSGYSLTQLVSFLEKFMPEVTVSMEVFLPQILKHRPDVLMFWCTSSCYDQVEVLANIVKQNLDIPILLGGPHISHLPQSLPDSVDVGILGEPELPLKQLLSLFLKDPKAGPMHYGRVPGLIYQSRGRIYSGKPAQIVSQIDQLPFPKHHLFHRFPSAYIPIVQTSRGESSLLALSAFLPSSKLRLHSAAYVANELKQIQENYEMVQKHLPLPAFLKKEIRPVFIADETFVSQPKHLAAIVQKVIELNLEDELSFIVNVQAHALTEQACVLLQKMKVRRVVLHFPGVTAQTMPELQSCPPRILLQALKSAKKHDLEIIGCYYLNPHYLTSRKEMARTYAFTQKYAAYFSQLKVRYIPPFPGTDLWKQYQQEHKLDSHSFAQVPWHLFDSENYQVNSPLVNKSISPSVFHEIYQAFHKLTHDPSKFSLVAMPGGLEGKAGYQSIEMTGAKHKEIEGRKHYAKLLRKKYIKSGQRVLHVFVNQAHQIQEYIGEDIEFHCASPSQGKFPFKEIKGQFDFIVFTHALEALREPQQDLERLKEYLSPEGSMLFQALNKQSAPLILSTLQWPAFHSFYSNPNLKYYSEDTLKALFCKVGFEIMAEDYTIMKNTHAFRGTIEGLVKQIHNFWPIPVKREQFYILELMILVKMGDMQNV